MKEDPTRDGDIRWMSWVLGSNKNVQRTDDPVVGVHFVLKFKIFINVFSKRSDNIFNRKSVNNIQFYYLTCTKCVEVYL